MSNHNNSIDESQQAEQAKTAERPQPSEQQAQSAEQPQLSGQMGIIYKITCLVNGKGYVGKTRQKLNDRIRQHKNDGKHGRPGIDAAIEKYKWENFTVEILEECPVELLSDREIFFIATLKTKAPNGYNLTDGGESCLGFKHTDESRAKMSAAKKGKSHKPHSPETKAKIAAKLKGRPSPAKGKPSPKKGQKCSPETCAKMSAAKKGKKGKPHSEETKAKIAATSKGRKHSNETKAKMSAAQKAAWARRKKAVENGGK